MKKLIVMLLSVAGLTLTGCQTNSIVVAKPTSKPLPVPVQAVVSSTGSDGLNDPMPAVVLGATSGISPGTVEIGNYYPGATAEWKMLIHNGDGLKAKLLQITTEPNETVADIPLKVILAGNGLFDIDSITSSLEGEKLDATAYDATTQLVTIKGFTPNATRTVKITYKTLSAFKVYVKYPSTTKAGYAAPPLDTNSWVTMDNTEVLLRPLENGYVVCSLKVPQNVKIDANKWEFWIGVTEKPENAQSQVATQIELCSRILVTMR